MIALLCCFRHRDHPIRLNVDFHQDLQWWLTFFKEWNGVFFFLSSAVSPLPDLVVSSDASDSHGFGALWRTEWFCSSWFFLPLRLSRTVNSSSSKSPDVMHLLRLLTLEACRHNFVFSAAHTPGRDNSAADTLSRLRLQEFRRLAPHADQVPRPIPPSLLSLLVPPA